MKKIFFTLLLLLNILFVQLNAQTIYTDFGDFKDACANAQAGDEIILADGQYDSESVTIDTKLGTPENPIIIRSETIGGAVLNDGTYFDLRHCEYITIQGFEINISERSTTFKIQTCNNIRITQNVLDGTNETAYEGDERQSSVWVSIQSMWDDTENLSHHNRIDHNVFKNKETLGNMIKIDGTDSKYVSHHDVIEYNYFKNMGPRADNEMEAIRIGWSAMSQSDGYCTVSNNVFEECNGDPEIVSVKCNKNTISHNTFRRCQGTLSLRHGNETLVEGNFFLGEGEEGTGGVRIYGSDHIIINNYFEGLTGTYWDAPITLTEGDVESTSTSLSSHYRIERAIIANNTLVNNSYGIEIGMDNNEKYSKPPRDVVMAYNLVTGSSNSLVNYINQPDNMTWIDNIIYPTDQAVASTNVSFSSAQAQIINPNLSLNAELNYYKSTETTPSFAAFVESVSSVVYDMEGQLRTLPTNYGADEYSSSSIIYKPLAASEVGPATGEYLYVSKTEIACSALGTSEVIAISSNLNWQVTGAPEWITLLPTSGSSDGTVSVTVAKNETGIEREATFIISSVNTNEVISYNITVNQSNTEPATLELSKLELSFANAAGSENVTLISNVSWTVSENLDWISVSPLSGTDNETLVISVDENTDLTARSGEITVSDGASLTETILVSQEARVGTEIKLVVDAVTASAEQVGNEAVNVNDGRLDTRWSGEGDGVYIDLDLGELNKVSYMKIGLFKGADRTSSFDILTSEDNVDYTMSIENYTTPITSEAMILVDFDDVNARYVRLLGHGNSSSAWNSYSELEVWGWTLGGNTAIAGLENSSIEVYPNPSKGSFRIANTSKADVIIYSLTGKKVFQAMKVAPNFELATSLEKGIYILSVKENNLVRKAKIVIE